MEPLSLGHEVAFLAKSFERLGWREWRWDGITGTRERKGVKMVVDTDECDMS